MPRGTCHTLTGILGWDKRNHIHVLNMGDGGYWFVDMPGRTKHLIGREVTVEGVRSGFNMLDAHCLLAIDGAAVTSGRRAALALLFARFALFHPAKHLFAGIGRDEDQ